MEFIRLNIRTIPVAPDKSRVFPFLQMEIDSSGTTIYRFALLVSDDNGMLVDLLSRIGFVKSNEATPLASWSFFTAESNSPFAELTDRSSDPDTHKRSTYLKFENDPVTGDTTIGTVVKSDLDVTRLNDGAEVNFFEIDLAKDNGVSDGWIFNWGEENKSPEVFFTIPLQAKFHPEGNAAGLVLSLESLDQNLPATDPWSGCQVKLDDIIIQGSEDGRLSNSVYAIDGTSGEVVLEISKPKVNLSLGSVADIEVISDVLVIRHSKTSVAGCLKEEDVAEVEEIKLNATFELVMAPTSTSPVSLSLIVPLLKGAERLRFGFEFAVTVGPEFNRQKKSILSLDKEEGWRLSNDLWEAVEIFYWPISAKAIQQNSLKLGGLEWSLADLVGEALGVSFAVSSMTGSLVEDDRSKIPCRLESGAIVLPVLLDLNAGDMSLEFCLDLSIDPKTFRLSTNRLYWRLPAALNCESTPILDLFAFAIIFPVRPAAEYFSSRSVDGYIDFADREFVVFAPVDEAVEKPLVVIPGNLGNKDLSQRLLFEFHEFFPDVWPKTSKVQRSVFLRIGSEGLSLYAKVMTAHSPNVLKQGENRRALGITPLAERNGKASEIVIIDNIIRKAVLYGEFEVPGVDDLLAKVEIGMRQDKRGQPPVVHAEVDLDTTNGKPLANFSAGYLQIQIDDMRARLEWNLDNDEWDLSVPVDASFMLANEISKTGGLDDLRDPDVIKVRDLDLIRIHEGFGEITLPLPDAVNFSCLDGMFAVSLKKLRFGWGKTFYLECDEAEFAYLDPGTLQVAIEVGGVYLEFSGGGQIKMRNPDRIGIDVTIDDSVRFRGAVAWVDNDRETYFAAAGTLAIEGMPEAKTVLKIGTGRKLNGQIVPNITFYGSMDYEVTLFSGVVAKNFGAGIGINNRLTGIDERPNAEKLLANIDSIDPSRISGWQFVERNGFYLSIVGTTIIASNPGGNSGTNAYVASLLLSIDVDLNIVAAGKVWLASSVDYVRKRENWSRPALVGAIAILPREQLFTAAIESRQNPAIESSEQLSKILNKGHTKLSFLLSPDLVDFFLQDVSYSESFLGVDMLYRGSFRLAVFSGTVLVRASQLITGTFSERLEAGPGGFSCRGDIAVGVEFGGLLSRDGLAAYGMIAIQVLLDVDAWITIGFSITIGWGRWKKRLSFKKTFRLDSTRLEIGLCGAVAFNERGEFGFAGELSISISVCGYRLSVSPSLKIREEVIVGVRRRVALFEHKIETYRQKLLTGEGDATALVSMADSEPPETWLHYQIGEWHLLVPQADATWFTPHATEPEPEKPIPFSGHVVSIKVNDSITLRMPWDQDSWSDPNSDGTGSQPVSRAIKDALEEIEATMAETTVAGKEPISRSLSEYVIITDPRIESPNREFWLEIDQALLPDHALPVRMKSADQILHSGEAPQDFNSTYGRLVNFLFWSQRAIIERRHSGNDLLPEEDLEQRRAAVLFEIVRAFHTAAKTDENASEPSAWVATEQNGRRGLIFKQDGLTFDNDGQGRSTMTVVRGAQAGETGSSEEPVTVTVLDVNTLLSKAHQSVRLYSPRQEYVVDVEASDKSGEEGRVVVRLPIGYDDTFFHDYLPLFSHFEVWRRIRGQGKPVRVGSYQLPSLTYLNNNPGEKPVVVVDPYIFADEFRVRGKLGERLFDLGVIADRTLIDYAIRFVPIDDQSNDEMAGLSPWQPVKLHVPAPDTFPIDLSMVFDVGSLLQPNDPATSDNTWTHFQLASMGDERVTLALTDEWERKNKTEAHQPRDFQIWVEERLIVDSGFYAGSADEARRSLVGGAEPNLGALSADQPVLSLSDKFQIEVEPVAGEPGTWVFSNTQPFKRDGYAYRFYIRPIYQGESGDEGDEAEGTLRSLTLAISKNIPSVANKTEPKFKDMSDAQLDAFVSAPETHFWYENRKGLNPAAPGLRTVRQIEWIDQAEVDLLNDLCFSDSNETPIDSIVPVSVSARSLERDYPAAKRRRRVGISWNHSGRTHGGVEIQIRDRDDAAVAARFVCQMREYTAYQHSIRDFSNDSAWRLTRRENVQRLTPPESTPPGVPVRDAVSDSDFEKCLVNQTLFLDNGNPLIQLFTLHKVELTSAIESGADWDSAAIAASGMMAAIGEFEKSPLNLNDKPLQTVISQIEALVCYLFLGLEAEGVKDLDELTTERIESINSALRNTLLDIDDLNPESADFEDSEDGAINARKAFLDADYARKLTSIIRRRWIIGEDVLATVGEGLPLSAVERDQDRNWLPRGAVFEFIRNKQAEADKEFGVGGSLPNVTKLLKWFPETTEKPKWASDRLKEAVDELQSLITYESEDNGRRKAAASVVAKAAGLTIGLQRLERQFETDGWRLERRPHHRVTVAENNIGAKAPELIEMKVLLPDSHRSLDDVGGSTPTGSSSEPHLVAYFNLLERMGFALDLGGTDETGEPLPQADLVDAIRRANLEVLFEQKQNTIDPHYVYLVTPREPDSEYRGQFPDPSPDSNQDNAYFYAGFSFVKLIIVPKLFHDLLISHHPLLNPEQESVYDKLKDWFEIRGVILESNEANAKRQVELFARVAYFASWQRAEDKTKPVAVGQLLQLRMMPLELHYRTVPHVNGFAHIDWETPDRRGHRFEVSARSMSRYEPLIRWARDLPRPEVTHAGAELDARRIITRDDGVDLPIPLPISNFPHPELLRFSYTLPPAGIRSLLNRISAIRTGYRGCQLTFQYSLVDHDEPDKRWEKIVQKIMVEATTETVVDSSPVIVPTPRSSTAEVRLFRHERLITLEEIPYFYAVQLSVNGQFEGDLEGAPPQHDPMTDSEPARRMPAVIAYRPPVVRTPEEGKYAIEVVLTRLGEMASPAELAGGVPLLSPRTFKGGTKSPLPDDVLPMPALGYHFYYRVADDSDNAEANSDSIYRSVVDLLMPWQEGYQTDDAKGAKPYVRSFDSAVEIIDPYPEIELRTVTGTDPEELVPVVTVTFKTKEDKLFDDASRRYIQVSCYGKLTAATLLRESS